MTKSILPDLSADLEDYLDRMASEWQRQPEGSRVPTLPSTAGGKVNVRAVILALMRPRSQEQHLFNKPVLRSAIDAVAIEQGLDPIGASAGSTDGDGAVQDRMRRAEKRASDVGRFVAEQAAVIEKQRRTITALREQIRIFEETGQVLRTAPVRT